MSTTPQLGTVGAMPQAPTLSPDTARTAMEIACTQVGLDSAGAEPMRFGENAMYRLALDPIIVRVSRSATTARKETEVAAWLRSYQFPAVDLAHVPEQPVSVDGLAVTFWRFITEAPGEPTSGELGTVLHGLHHLPPPERGLPEFEPMPKTESRLAALEQEGRFGGDLAMIRDLTEHLRQQYGELEFDLPLGPIHCDAHPGNLMRDQDGVVRLIDFEDFAYGPREWDLCVTATRYDAFGWLAPEEYRSFANAYGYDVLGWPGYPVLRRIRELNMTTWLMQLAGQSPDIDDEIRVRISDLRDSSAPRSWRVF